MLAIGHTGTAPCICTEVRGPGLLLARADCPVTGLADGVTEVAFSPDGNRVVSGSNDIRVHSLEQIWDARFSCRSGTPRQGLVQIWDAKTGAEVRSYGGGRSGGGC